MSLTLQELWQVLVALVMLLSGEAQLPPEWLPEELAHLRDLPWEEVLDGWPGLLPPDLTFAPQMPTLPPASALTAADSRRGAVRPLTSASAAPGTRDSWLGAAATGEAIGASPLPVVAPAESAAAWTGALQAESRVSRRTRLLRTSSNDASAAEAGNAASPGSNPLLSAGLGSLALGLLSGLVVIAVRRRGRYQGAPAEA